MIIIMIRKSTEICKKHKEEYENTKDEIPKEIIIIKSKDVLIIFNLFIRSNQWKTLEVDRGT